MNNVFANAASYVANMTYTENGHPVASTTGSALLDLYGQVGALRGKDIDRIHSLFDRAVAEDRLLAAKILFYTRDVRGGVGERDLFRTLLKYAAQKYPDIVVKNLGLIYEYGRWDDMYALVGTPLEDDMFKILKIWVDADISRIEIGRPVSLIGKWLKSCNASSQETRNLGRLTAQKFGMSEREYRKLLSKLRKEIKIVETKMSNGEWNDIEYDKIPSKAGLIYREAFKRHDGERYSSYIEAVNRGEKKINAATNIPQDLVHIYRQGGNEDPTVEAMWKNLPDYIDSDENVMCMVDVSGSMIGRPIEVSTGLGMYFAQHNRGAFHNLFMTFETEPSFCKLDDNLSFYHNLMNVFRAPWGGSTDLNRACEAMLDFAIRNHVPQSDMPTRLLIISDMEIDCACRMYQGLWSLRRRDLSGILHIHELQNMYAAHGYSVPQVIYWNVDSRDNHFHTKSDVPGTMLASGSSPAVFKAVMAMEDLDVTPYEAMLEVLNGLRYEAITIASQA